MSNVTYYIILLLFHTYRFTRVLIYTHAKTALPAWIIYPHAVNSPVRQFNKILGYCIQWATNYCATGTGCSTTSMKRQQHHDKYWTVATLKHSRNSINTYHDGGCSPFSFSLKLKPLYLTQPSSFGTDAGCLCRVHPSCPLLHVTDSRFWPIAKHIEFLRKSILTNEKAAVAIYRLQEKLESSQAQISSSADSRTPRFTLWTLPQFTTVTAQGDFIRQETLFFLSLIYKAVVSITRM